QIAFEQQADILPIAIKNTDIIWPKHTFGLNSKTTAQIKFLPIIESKNFDKISDLAKFTQLKIEEALSDS
ncbi:MAG: hypothetical protein KAG14_04995, partial [Mycoplasmataceae bacterium]|nr:hypothetical protein [Mycoplasmataceae bacterium]